jgi:rhodanese-related sulfurtransferase
MVDGRVARLARRADRDPAAGDTEVTMPRQIDRDGVRRLADQGAQLVEVLPASEYAKDHLPGASNLPLRKLEQQATAVLDRQRAVVVYCSDST